jgi:hypothetical protein
MYLQKIGLKWDPELEIGYEAPPVSRDPKEHEEPEDDSFPF